MPTVPTTVAGYLQSLPPDRRASLSRLRRVILDNLDEGFEEGIQYGMIGYYVPHALFPAGYHCDPRLPLPFASIASRKGYMTLAMMCVYSDSDYHRWFTSAWTGAGKRLDMGKACIRFKRIEDVPLEVVGEAFRRVTAERFIASYVAGLTAAGKWSTERPGTTAKPPRPPPASKAKPIGKKAAGSAAVRKPGSKPTSRTSVRQARRKPAAKAASRRR